MSEPTPLVAIVGPTGSGKSSLAVDVAHELQHHGHPAEIVSADAMQLYRGMDIGTAKVTEAEMGSVPHHLLDVWEPSDEASVQDYQRLARAQIEECISKAVIPIVVGGSGLYVSSVLYQFQFPGTDQHVRERLEQELEQHGLKALAKKLVEHDPEAAQAVDLNNPRRVLRALEVLEITGEPITAGLKARGELWHRPTVVVGIEWPREQLIARIDQRVESMWAAGLVDEVRGLRDSATGLGKTAAQAIGYREVLDYLAGDITEGEAKDQVAQHTRRYARKQMSWFRRDENIHWLAGDAPDLPGVIRRKIVAGETATR